MTSPYILPDWLPWWIALILVLIALVYALIFLLVPFSVFGIKPRLEAIEEQLQAMQEELRTIALASKRTGLYPASDDLTYVAPPRQTYANDPASRLSPAPPRDNAADIPARDSLNRAPFSREPLGREPLGREPAGKMRGTPQRVVGKRIEPRLD